MPNFCFARIRSYRSPTLRKNRRAKKEVTLGCIQHSSMAIRSSVPKPEKGDPSSVLNFPEILSLEMANQITRTMQ